MLIKKVEIEGYKLFESVGIKKIEIDFNSPIVIIIGTNGCGKSSFLRALTPYSQDKSLFHKSGNVNLTIDHDKEYEVGVNYKEKYQYYFKEEGINKNDSGNTGTHNHTVEEYFEYSSEIDKLMRMEYRMSKMKKNERKEFLMHFNPYDLSMVLDYQKKISSIWRGIKNNIKMLNQRKAVLEDKSISKEEMEKLKKEVSKVKKEYENYDKALLLSENRLTSLKRELSQYESYRFNLINLNWFENELKNITDKLREIWKNKKEVFFRGKFIKIEEAERLIDEVNKEIGLLRVQIQDKISKLNEYKSYQQLDLEKEIKPRKERILVIEEEIRKIGEFDISIPELSIDTYKEFQSNYIPIIFKAIQNLIRNKVRIYSLKSLNVFKSHFHHLSYLSNNLVNEIAKFKEEEIKLKNELIRINNNSYPVDCLTNNCFLKNNVAKRIRHINDQLTQIENSLKKKEKKYKVYSKAIKRLSIIIEESELYKEEMEIFRDLHKSFSWFIHYICNKRNIIEVLNRDINIILFNSKKLIEEINDRISFINLNEEKNRILFELLKLEDPKIPVNELLNDIVGHLEKDIKDMQNRYKDQISKLQLLSEYSSNRKEYQDFLDRLSKLKDKYEVYQKYYLIKVDSEIFKVITEHIRKEKDILHDTLIRSETLMKEQENIHLILYKEIIPSLEELVKKEKKYGLIDQALNPTNGLPRKYLVGYLNRIINNANYILSQTWNYELQIALLEKEGEIDFTFERIVNGEKASDISLCSESQKDMIDIAWNLSMILSTGYGKKYPVYFDEIDKHFDEGHREKLITLLNVLIKNDNIRQLFLVNHHAALSSGLKNCQTICLSTNNISVPAVYNENVTIHYK